MKNQKNSFLITANIIMRRKSLIDDKITYDEDKILEELAKYYEMLYTENIQLAPFIFW